MVMTERVSAHLNRALGDLLDAHADLVLLGEDIADPYGGAFKVTRGLSERHPDRVITTPVSEAGIVGVASGLALCGRRVIVEVMFGDFLALAFDPLVNFAAKSVAMYGRRVPMRLVVRCPVGGNRGYGPTHSQSPQKHLLGVPHLRLYEVSRFHDARAVLDEAFAAGEPAVLFEDKVLYGRTMQAAGTVDDRHEYAPAGGAAGWAHVRPRGTDACDLAVIAPGGAADRAADAARRLLDEDGVAAHVLVPARLHPLDLDPVLHVAASAGRVVVAEESTAHGAWGAEVAHRLHSRLWDVLRAPVALATSADSVIPAAPHLERAVVLQAETIVEAARAVSGPHRRPRPADPPRSRLAGGPAPAEAAQAETEAAETEAAETERTPARDGTAIAVPKLNSNDDGYVVAEWLCEDGAEVAPDTPVVALETSKAQVDLPAGGAGVLTRVVPEGAPCRVGDVLGVLRPTGADGDGREKDGREEEDHARRNPV